MTTATASSTPAFMKTVKISSAVFSEGAPTFSMGTIVRPRTGST